jgi:hypothetical protein
VANFKTQQVDVQDENANVSISVLPETGHILPFAGPSDKIPAGWVLCDGNNGTPDLRGKLPGGISNLSVGSSDLHTHNFTHSLGSFNSSTAAGGASVSAANIGNNSANHSHGIGANVYIAAWGDSGPANRSNGNQSNVIGRNHSHGGFLSSGATGLSSGGNNSAHSHSYNAYPVNATTANSHSHTISSSPTVNTQQITHNNLPSIFYVNFIMKV